MTKNKKAYVELKVKNPDYVQKQIDKVGQYLQELKLFRKRFNKDLDKLLKLASEVENFFEIDVRQADNEKT